MNQATLANDELPTPSQLPKADVVVFDGHCRFCRASVARLRWLDGKDRLAFVSLHDPLIAERYPDLDHDTLMSEMYLVDQKGNRHGGAAALKYLSRRLPSLWILAPLLHLPFTMPVWRYFYRFVAKRRYLIAGRTIENGDDGCADGTCSVHFKD